MLRVSSEAAGEHVDLQGIVDGENVETGIPGDAALLAFTESALGDDGETIANARQRVVDELGEPAMIDAAGIIANFQRMVRIADGTGIPLDAPVAAMSADIRENLGINAYVSADCTPEPSWLAKLLARLFRPLIIRRLRSQSQSST